MSVKTLALAAAPLALLSACNQGGSGNGSTPGQPAEAQKKAGDQTIAAGLDANSRFTQAAKAAGLDGTLAGPGPVHGSRPPRRSLRQGRWRAEGSWPTRRTAPS